jgi:hypothetical protein
VIKYCNQFLLAGTIDLSDFNMNLQNVVTNNYKSWETYQNALESKCYKVVEYYVPTGDLKSVLLNVDCLELDCFDIHERPNKFRENPEEHTNIWDKFITSFGNNNRIKTRLNPEFTIFWRDIVDVKPSKYLRNGSEVTRKNRRNKPKYRLLVSISQNSLDKPKPNKEIKTLDQINEFNIKFKESLESWKNKDGYFTFYGIDRGSDEMATICKVAFNPEIKYENSPEKDYNFNLKPQFEPFELYRLKNGIIIKDNPELIQILKNPSQWTTDYENRIEIFNKYFEAIQSSCLDLTMAKVIKSKYHEKQIILEIGDLFTYQKFALLNAKMKIAEQIMTGVEKTDLIWDNEKSAWSFDAGSHSGGSQNYDNLLYYRANLETESKEDIRKALEGYIKNYDKVSFEQKENLNKYKKSLAANMVGVLDCLYQQEKGFIILENLAEVDLNKQTNNTTSNHRQLEQSIYQKWQSHCTVPPKVNMPSMWEELFDKKDKNAQLGNVILIDESGTSKNCPRCGKRNQEYNIPKTKNETFEVVIARLKINNPNLVDQKWIQHRFGCVGSNTGNCGFDTGSSKVMPNITSELFDLISLKTSDSVASYNIAKRGLGFLTNNNINKADQNIINQSNNRNTSKKGNTFKSIR